MLRQIDLIPGLQSRFNMYKSIDVTHYINAVKDKSWMIISVNMQRLFDRIQNDLLNINYWRNEE